MEQISKLATYIEKVHDIPSLFKDFSCFYKQSEKTGSYNTPKRKKINFVQTKHNRHKICLKTAKTTENVARYFRRKDTYPVGV